MSKSVSIVYHQPLNNKKKSLCLWPIVIGCFVCVLISSGYSLFNFIKNQRQIQGYPCLTPFGEKTTCQPWYNCTVILEALTNQEPFSKEFAEASMCGDSSLVCCGSLGNFDEDKKTSHNFVPQSSSQNFNEANKTKAAKIEFALKHLLPSKKYCGLQHTDDYFYNKTETSLDEFPWLVYIPFTQSFLSKFYPGVKFIRSTGFLISNRYAITQNFCGSGRDFIKKIFIGQYNREKRISCIENSENPDFTECTEPLIEAKVAHSAHPDFHSIYRCNIRLLRLEKQIVYSDYVRPICLPLNELKRANIGDTLVTSGWGALEFKDSEGKIKKRRKYTLEIIEVESDYNITTCASPQRANETVCAGDDGGPLMYSYKNQWFAEGILTLYKSTDGCDDPSKLMCAVRITPIVIEWILLNMEP